MSDSKPEKVMEEVRELAPDELQHVRELVDPLLSEPDRKQMTEDEFERHLARQGVVSLPAQVAEDDDNEGWQPVKVISTPLSEKDH